MVSNEYAPSLLIPGTRGWIVGPTYELAEKEFRIFWDIYIHKLKLGDTPGLRKAYNQRTGEMFLEFPWGSSVHAKSAQKPDTLVGESLDWVIMSEAAKLPSTVWEKYIRPSLADKRGSAVFPTTPEGYNWIYDLTQLAATEDEYETWNFPSWENPFVYPYGFDDPEIQILLRTMPKAWFEQEIASKFVSFMGQIYDEFDSSVHIRKWKYRPGWRDVAGIDFGYTNPFVWLDAQVGPSGQLAIWREYYVSRQPTWVHANVLKNRENPTGYDPRGHTWADPEDPDGIASLARMLGPIGARAVPWQSSVMEVKQRLINFVDEDDNMPMLIVDPSCKNTIREFNRFRVKEGREGLNAAEVAEKTDDHAMSALRYLVWNELTDNYSGLAELNETRDTIGRNFVMPLREDVGGHFEAPDLLDFAHGLQRGEF
jgi:hypothetical protein